MSKYHPYIPAVEDAVDEISQDVVDLGAVLTGKGRDRAHVIIERIESAAKQIPNCPLLIEGESFVAGSLGRRTQEKPLDDVDVYLVMEAPLLTAVNGFQRLPLTSHYSMPSTPLTHDSNLKVGNLISADAVLDRFVNCLPLWFPDDQTGKGNAGKTAYVKRGGVNVDLSPVLWYASDVGGIDQYWMPAGHSVSWKPTNPKEDQKFLSTANQAHDGDLLKIIRMMKWWNATFNDDRLKGIHLETMIVNAFQGKSILWWSDSLHYLFGVLSEQLQHSCPDPTGLSDPLDSSLSAQDRQGSRDALWASYILVDQAKALAEAEDIAGCLAKWRIVFFDLPRQSIEYSFRGVA